MSEERIVQVGKQSVDGKVHHFHVPNRKRASEVDTFDVYVLFEQEEQKWVTIIRRDDHLCSNRVVAYIEEVEDMSGTAHDISDTAHHARSRLEAWLAGNV